MATAKSDHPKLVAIAPAAEVAQTFRAESGSPPLMAFTCITCARRKVKCDKTGPPCSTCRKARQECIYQEPPPRKRKRKQGDELQERLERYERLLKENGIAIKDEQKSPATQSSSDTLTPTSDARAWRPSDVVRERSADKLTGTLLKGPGKTRYIDSNIWRHLGEDMHPSSDEEDGGYNDNDETLLSGDPLDPVSSAFFQPMTAQRSLLQQHPTYDLARKLWSQYVQNVDPICKICHVPTTQDLIERAAANPGGMSRVTECLVFSIYHFAVYTCSETECESILGGPKKVLLKRYHDAARQALVTCRFLRTAELVVLQAYILFLLPMRNVYDPHTFWVLTGIAVRLGQRMGLHRDGADLGLNPFDTEVRRRVFWQLLPLDGMSSQLSGTGIAISADSWDVKQPLNINDADIWPDMEEKPMPRTGATDMTFVLARTELGKFHQKVKPFLGNWSAFWDGHGTSDVRDVLKELENTMEEKYVRYCDISDPMHCLTVSMVRGALAIGRLKLALADARREGTTPIERKKLAERAYKVLDHAIAARANPNLTRYLWHLTAFFQWDPMIWLLNEIRREDSVTDASAVWDKIERIYSLHPELSSARRSIDVAMARLTLKAWDTTQMKAVLPRPDPKFIFDLNASIRRREVRQPTAMATQQPDLFDPTLDMSTEIPIVSYLDSSQILGSGNYGMLDDVNANFDWMFWNQLIRDPMAFPYSEAERRQT